MNKKMIYFFPRACEKSLIRDLFMHKETTWQCLKIGDDDCNQHRLALYPQLVEALKGMIADEWGSIIRAHDVLDKAEAIEREGTNDI